MSPRPSDFVRGYRSGEIDESELFGWLTESLDLHPEELSDYLATLDFDKKLRNRYEKFLVMIAEGSSSLLPYPLRTHIFHHGEVWKPSVDLLGAIEFLKRRKNIPHALSHFLGFNENWCATITTRGNYIVSYDACNWCGREKNLIKLVRVHGEDEDGKPVATVADVKDLVEILKAFSLGKNTR